MSDETKIKRARGGRRAGAGRRPVTIDVATSSALDLLHAVVSDPKAPITARTKAAAEILRHEQTEAERRETQAIRRANARFLREAGI